MTEKSKPACSAAWRSLTSCRTGVCSHEAVYPYCVMVRVITRLGPAMRGGGKNQVTAPA